MNTELRAFIINQRTVLLDVKDGPEAILIYTSDHESVSDWGNDIPGLYIEASLMGADFKLGPFQMSSIRKEIENIVAY
jgi:hypothetical protein